MKTKLTYSEIEKLKKKKELEDKIEIERINKELYCNNYDRKIDLLVESLSDMGDKLL